MMNNVIDAREQLEKILEMHPELYQWVNTLLFRRRRKGEYTCGACRSTRGNCPDDCVRFKMAERLSLAKRGLEVSSEGIAAARRPMSEAPREAGAKIYCIIPLYYIPDNDEWVDNEYEPWDGDEFVVDGWLPWAGKIK